MPPPSCPVAAARNSGAAEGILRCRVSTLRALRSPVASALLRAIQKRLPVPLLAPEDVEVALHEAVLNAAIHGNLGVTWTETDPAAAFDAFLVAIAERSENRTLAGRKIDIDVDHLVDRLVITIRDEGAGYVPTAAVAGRAAPHGRGFLLMRAAGVVERRLGGREVRLIVPLHRQSEHP